MRTTITTATAVCTLGRPEEKLIVKQSILLVRRLLLPLPPHPSGHHDRRTNRPPQSGTGQQTSLGCEGRDRKRAVRSVRERAGACNALLISTAIWVLAVAE